MPKGNCSDCDYFVSDQTGEDKNPGRCLFDPPMRKNSGGFYRTPTNATESCGRFEPRVVEVIHNPPQEIETQPEQEDAKPAQAPEGEIDGNTFKIGKGVHPFIIIPGLNDGPVAGSRKPQGSGNVQ